MSNDPILTITFDTGFSERLLAGIIEIHADGVVRFWLRAFQVEPYTATEKLPTSEFERLEAWLLDERALALKPIYPSAADDFGSFRVETVWGEYASEVQRPIDWADLNENERALFELVDRLIGRAAALRER